MAFGERWLTALWPFVAASLPAAPARVLELGCGPLGGFVPSLLANGYEAIGVDRNAPSGERYRQVDFEHLAPAEPVDAIVASRSLHHVGDLRDVIGRVAVALRPGGSIVVAEWAWERFDVATAQWCFERLGDADPADPGWLHRRRRGWLDSDLPWDAYFEGWAGGHGLHRAGAILAELGRCFETATCTYGPYFFADLADFAEDDERTAIESGAIRATGIRYAGTLGS